MSIKRVVVSGIGAISPLGLDASTMWDKMKNGENGIDFITKFDTSDYKAKLAAEVKNFDPLKYFSKGDLRKTDLFTMYAVAAACEAVEDSGIMGKVEPENFGVYVGSGIGGINTLINESYKLKDEGPRKVSPFFVPMMITNMAGGTIAIKFNAQGASLPIVSACATGTNSIGEAYRAVKHGYLTAAITGGSEASITGLAVAGFINCMALSQSEDKNAASLPFDKRRSGFVMGEGSGILIIEEYGHAVARGAKIYAEVVGYGNTCDAYHITAPNPEGIASAKAVSLAIKESGYNREKAYVNAHGTGTPLNDKTETLAYKMAFGDNAKNLNISSTKSMTGHMLGAAGAIEAIASVLALKEGIIPPTINYAEPDSECDLNITPNKAVKSDIEYAFSTSLGFGGHNACLAFKKLNEK